MTTPDRNSPCPCGSGKKYKKCCRLLDEGQSARCNLANASRALKEKNVALLQAMFEIFGLERPWDKVKDGMSDAQIREFYKFIADLWPVNTNLLEILPSPDSSLRALYLGENEPEMMLPNVFRFCLYADQILLVNPFDNPNLVAEQFNPLARPGEWRLQTIRVVFQLMMLAPWIDAGLVVLIPDPGDFNRRLRVQTWNLAAERLKGMQVTDKDIEASVMKRRTRNTLLLSPRSYLEHMARKTNPGISDQDVRKTP